MNVEHLADLQFRLISHKDAAALFTLLSFEAVAQFNDYAPITCKGDVRDLIQGDIEMQLEQTGCRLAIVHRKCLIGTVGLYNLQDSCAELGFELHPDYWGQGLMQRAVGHLLARYNNYLESDISVVTARVDKRNTRCCNTLLSLGFTRIDETRWRKQL